MKQQEIENKITELKNQGHSMANICYDMSKLTGLSISLIEQAFNSVSDLYWKYAFDEDGKVNSTTINYNKITAVLLHGMNKLNSGFNLYSFYFDQH